MPTRGGSLLGELALGSLDLAPLIRWSGGKARFAHRVLGKIPRHGVYVEPFFGGGGFFFRKPEAALSILGDVSPRTIRFHVAVRNGALRRCREGVRLSRIAVERGQDSSASACAVFAASGSGYHGSTSAAPAEIRRAGRSFGRVKLRHLATYEHMLRRAYLTRGDFRRTIRMGESMGGAGAFYFVDPPWPGVGDYSKMYKKLGGRDGSMAAVSPARVREAFEQVTGRVWITYNDHPEVRRAFVGRARWRVTRMLMPTADPRGGGMRSTAWLLITNYDLGR